MAAVEPPGNVARDLALFRRGLFAALGEASALAFPELLPLVVAPCIRSAILRARGAADLAGCWDGVEGSFGSGGLSLAGGSLYLAASGPVAPLAARVAEALGAGESPPELPLVPGLGYFLCRPAQPEAALEEARRLGPPPASFLDCSLVLVGIRVLAGPGADPFLAATWSELARARRRTGPSRPRS
jgi:hypothetical protein